MDLSSFEREFISLICGAVNNKRVYVSEDFKWDRAFDLAMRHNVMSILFYAAQANNVPENIMNKIHSIFLKNIVISENQMYYISRISNAFEVEDIDFVLLKGTILKAMYPSNDMRFMGDADILIKTEQYDKIKPVLKKIGFVEQNEYDPEIVWNIHGLHLELHKSLFAKRNSDFYAYFGNIWNDVVLMEGKKHTYMLKPETNLVYMVSHLAKHMRNGGVGMRHVTDIWVYKSKVKFDERIVEEELEKLKLLEFYKNILKTIDVWFNNVEGDDTTDLITKWILSSGSFGTTEQYIIGKALKNQVAAGKKTGKATVIIKTIFPSYSLMCGMYPILNKVKILLPIMYIVRIFSRVLFKRGAINRCINKMAISTEDNVNSFYSYMKKIGINYDFIIHENNAIEKTIEKH